MVQRRRRDGENDFCSCIFLRFPTVCCQHHISWCFESDSQATEKRSGQSAGVRCRLRTKSTPSRDRTEDLNLIWYEQEVLYPYEPLFVSRAGSADFSPNIGLEGSDSNRRHEKKLKAARARARARGRRR